MPPTRSMLLIYVTSLFIFAAATPCPPFPATCPSLCSCSLPAPNSVVITCPNGGLTDSALHSVLMQLPRGITQLTVDGSAERRNRFSLTSDLLNFDRLEELRLRYGSIESLGHGAFRRLKHLRLLDVSQNMIASISPATFDGLDSLQTLVVSNNVLSALPSSVFVYISSLKSVNLSYNKIQEIPSGALQGPIALQSLDLSGNTIGPRITKRLFDRQTTLTTLALSNCNIDDIDVKTFTSLSLLKELDLSRNPMSYLTLHYPLLPVLGHLESLDLSYTNVNDLPDRAFQDSNLRTLKLAGNSARLTLRSMAFEGCDKLNSLDLSNMGISKFHAADFLGRRLAASLKSLTLNHNPLHQLPDAFSSALPNLQHLCLSNTSLTWFPSDALPNSLQVIDVSLNSLSSLGPAHLRPFKRLRTLDLSHCAIESLTDDTLYSLKAVPDVRLDGAKLPCGCELTDFYDLLPIDRCTMLPIGSPVICSSPVELAGRMVTTLKPDEFPVCKSLFGASLGLSQRSEIGILIAVGVAALVGLTLCASLFCGVFLRRKAEKMSMTSSEMSTVSTEQMAMMIDSPHKPIAVIVDNIEHIPPEMTLERSPCALQPTDHYFRV